jgi:alanine racemase
MVKILRRTDAPYLAVDSFPEYQIVKKYSSKQILLLGETLLENYRKFNHRRVTFCVYNRKTITALGELNKEIKIHLFFNTGMNREGIQEEQLPDILHELKKFPQITVEGVMSHLYSADEIDYDGIEEQIKKYRTMYYKLIDFGHTPLRKHIGNSAGMFKIQDDFFNAYRP